MIANISESLNKTTNLFTHRNAEISKIKKETLDKKADEILALYNDTNQTKIRLLKMISHLEIIEETVDSILSERHLQVNNKNDGDIIPLNQLLE